MNRFIYLGEEEIVALLLANGANKEQGDRLGITPSDVASFRGNFR